MEQALLTIDLKALAGNHGLFRRRVGPRVRVAGIVKADAYGLGMIPVAETLYAQGCRDFFVATLEEALSLRAALPDAPIAMLGGLSCGTEDDFIAHNIVPVLNSAADISGWKECAARTGRKLPAILHFDTGMNRLGLGADETAALLDDPYAFDGLDIRLVMSHFACADEKGHPLTAQQQARFEVIAAHFPGIEKSLANSSGIFRDTAYHYDLVRPGMGVYGLNPVPETVNPMQPVVRLEARILQIRNARKGETVGYGASHTLERDTRLATVGLGYADGFLRSLSGRGVLYYQGTPCPVIGRVSMDLVTVDIGSLPTHPGEMLEVLGPHQDADALAAAAGTIGYEILTSLGARYKRVYL